MTEFEQALKNFGELFITNIPFILSALITIILSVMIGNFVKKFLNQHMQKRWQESVFRNFVAEIIKWIIIIIGLVIALNLLGIGNIAGGLVAGAGVSALILGFAFKDIAENFLSGIILAINRPFQINDIIEVDKIKGPVKNLFLRVTHVRTADGRDIYIPNASIIKGVLINYTKDNILRHEFTIRVQTAENISKVRSILLKYLRTEKDVISQPLPQIQVEEFNETFVIYKIMFWVKFKNISSAINSDTGEPIKSKVINHVKELLLEKGILQPATTILEHKMFPDSKLNIDLKDPPSK